MPDLPAVHERLLSILAPYRDRFSVSESEQGMMLEVPGQEGQTWGFVAGTRLNKRYVSYYLMSVYAQPELLASISPELRRRMQGKSCFNFATVDERLLGELEELTSKAISGHSEAVAGAIARRSKRRQGGDGGPGHGDEGTDGGH
jgi:hypothetical protein